MKSRADTAKRIDSIATDPERTFRHWPAVYLGVVVYTLLLILLLALFSN